MVLPLAQVQAEQTAQRQAGQAEPEIPEGRQPGQGAAQGADEIIVQAERRAKEGRAAQLQQLQQDWVFHGSAQEPGEKAAAGAPRRLVDDGADLAVDLDLAAV